MTPVERGAALLDGLKPGWASTINESLLDLNNCFHCTLGQIYGGYWKALNVITGHTINELVMIEWFNFSIEHGFNLDDDSDNTAAWNQLRDEWLTQVAQRVEQLV